MAGSQDAAPRRQQLTSIATLSGLAIATALAFGRVFKGETPTLELVGVGVLSVLVAAALERRGLALATIVSALAMVWVAAIIVFPSTLWYGLPSRETLDALRHALGLVGEQAKVQVAPTEPLAPLMLAAVTALWTAAFSAHALAARAGSPILALLPPVALVGFADTVLEDGARPVYAGVFLLAALAVVFLDGLRRIRQWGPVWTSQRRSRVKVEGARSVAFIAVAAAVLIPGILPGFRSGPLVDFSTTGQGGAHLDPFVSILNQLNSGDPVPLFKVTTDQPSYSSYWRIETLDSWDEKGTGYQLADLGPPFEHTAPLDTTGQIPTNAQTPTPQSASDVRLIQQRFEILADSYDDPLPVGYEARTVHLSTSTDEAARYDSDNSAVLAPSSVGADYTYTVSSDAALPSPEALNANPLPPFPQGSDYPDILVPNSVSPTVERIAENWTQGMTTEYGKVWAILQRFRAPGAFDYQTKDLPATPPGTDPTTYFLTRSKIGFCQQFAAAMATLVRELHYPARVAIGYRPGEHQGSTYTVSSADAHAWVEVWFGPKFGWLPFDPTPQGARPVAPSGSYLNPATGGAGTGGASDTGATGDQTTPKGPTCDLAGRKRLPGQLCNTDRSHRFVGRGFDIGGRRGGVGTEEGGYHVPYRWGLLVALAILLVLAIAVPPAKAIRRRLTLRRARAPRERVLAVYRVFDGEASDLGLGRQEAETFDEYRARLTASIALTDGHLSRLTEVAVRAAYAGAEPSDSEIRAASEAANDAIRDLRRGAGLAKRVLGSYRPGW